MNVTPTILGTKSRQGNNALGRDIIHEVVKQWKTRLNPTKGK